MNAWLCSENLIIVILYEKPIIHKFLKTGVSLPKQRSGHPQTENAITLIPPISPYTTTTQKIYETVGGDQHPQLAIALSSPPPTPVPAS